MQVFSKNGVHFVIDLIWQRQNEENKVNLWQLKKDCRFDMYCKNLHNIAPTYGFARFDEQKIKKPISLALFILYLSEIEPDSEDMFICFRFDETRIGFILLYRGSIYPERGEYIGSEVEVRSRMITLAHEANIKLARVTDDVPFYDNHHFEIEAGFKILPLTSMDNSSLSSSNYYFWDNASFKTACKSASLQPIKRLATVYKLAIAILILIVALVLGSYLKSALFNNDIVPLIHRAPPANFKGVASSIFLNECFKDANSYFNLASGWKLKSYACKLQGVSISYVGSNASETSLRQQLEVILDNPKEHAKLKFSGNVANLIISFNLTRVRPLKLAQPLTNQVDTISKLSHALNFVFSIKSLPEYQIISKYSPIFLYKNGVLVNTNIKSIVMQSDANGFLNWTIQGELSGK